jgi:diguanylate cyclase (GGDEF)-like protein
VGRIGSDQLAAVVRAGTAVRVCTAINVTAVTASFWPSVSHPVLMGWLGCTLIISTCLAYSERQLSQRNRATLSHHAIRRSVVAAILLALPWAALPMLYLGSLPPSSELVLVTVAAGMASGGSVLLAPVYPAAVAYLATILLPFATKCFVLASAGYAFTGVLSLSFFGFLLAVIAATARISVERTEALRAATVSASVLRQRDAELSAQNARFETALNSMTQGLCFFDGDQELIVCNAKYIELHGLNAARVRPGISLSQILDMRHAAGTLPAMSKEDYLQWRDHVGRADHVSETVYEMNNGRIYAIRYRPLANGAWVATTDDITERQRLAKELEKNHKLLSERTSLLQVIIDNFPGGIGYYDKDLRVAVCNDKAKAILDLPERFFVNGPPRYEDILRFNAERGEYGPGDVDTHVARRLAIVAARQPYRNEQRMRRDGTVLDIIGHPIEDGGFITTYMDITERYLAEAKIAHLATHDALTGLPNRILFRERLDAALAAAAVGDRRVALLMLDLNKFKEVNDTLGHPAGDALLRQVANRLLVSVRAEDTVARLGGDEFAIVVHTLDAATDSEAIALRIREAIREPFDLDGEEVRIGVSIGIALDIPSAEALVKSADDALYKSKSGMAGRRASDNPARLH